MKALIVTCTFIAILVQGCSSMPRTKWTDRSMRVLLDPDSVDANHYVKITQALVESGKWVVIDRGQGYKAVKKEQERVHRDQGDRFLDREKFSHWGKLYGVGSIITAHAQCQFRQGWFLHNNYTYCQQFLAIVDSNSGEVITAVQGEASGGNLDYELTPSWEDTVAKLNDAFPKDFRPSKDEKSLIDYKALSAEESQRYRENHPQTERRPAKE